MQMYTVDRVTNILSIPYTLIYAVVPLSCLVMAARHILLLFSPQSEPGEEVA